MRTHIFLENAAFKRGNTEFYSKIYRHIFLSRLFTFRSIKLRQLVWQIFNKLLYYRVAIISLTDSWSLWIYGDAFHLMGSHTMLK